MALYTVIRSVGELMDKSCASLPSTPYLSRPPEPSISLHFIYSFDFSSSLGLSLARRIIPFAYDCLSLIYYYSY